KNLARAADLEIVHREIKARAQVLHELNRLEPLFRLNGKRSFRRRQEVGIRLMMRPADAAAQLMQLGEAELVGAMDDDRIGGGNVDAALDDRGAKQQIDALLVEV